MLNEHSKVSIAQTVFYVPIVPLAIYLLYRNAGKDPEWRGFPLYPSRSVSLPVHIKFNFLQVHSSSLWWHCCHLLRE
jgi:hypothetical protein